MSEHNRRANEEPLTRSQDHSDRIPAAERDADEVKVTDPKTAPVDAEVEAQKKLNEAADH